jgi:pimeloyl-ACP methyl ester carboxylesterase
MKPVVLVHGAWHGPWCWERVTPLLDAAGVPWVAPDLPSCARASNGAGLVDDVAEVEAALDALPGDEPAILLGHSRGGTVISEAGAHPRVGNLVYLTAFLLEEGEDPRTMVGDSVLPFLDFADDGTSMPKPADGPGVFYNDCSPPDIAWAMERLRPLAMAGLGTEVPRYAWRHKPSTFVICSIDRAIPAAAQRLMAKRAAGVVEWETGHSPFLNRPELVAELLISMAK